MLGNKDGTETIDTTYIIEIGRGHATLREQLYEVSSDKEAHEQFEIWKKKHGHLNVKLLRVVNITTQLAEDFHIRT